jgi:hypothetical protein
MAQTNFGYAHINTNATTTLAQRLGTLHNIVVNNAGTSATITVYDNTAASGAVIAVITPVAGGNYCFDAVFNNGLTVVTTGTPDITVTFG